VRTYLTRSALTGAPGARGLMARDLQPSALLTVINVLVAKILFSLLDPEPTRGLEPRTYRLQDSFSALTMAASSDFTVYSDRSGGHSGFGGRESTSHLPVTRRDRCTPHGAKHKRPN